MCSSAEVTRMIIPPMAAQKIISQMSQIYLRQCPCRVSNRRCPPDLWEVCLLFEHASLEELIEGHLITQQEALSIVNRMAKHKVIYNLFFHTGTGEITELCSCCTCCCKPLHRLKESGNFIETTTLVMWRSQMNFYAMDAEIVSIAVTLKPANGRKEPSI